MRPHYKLEAWKNAMDLVDSVYRITKAFPKAEIYGLTSQIRRSAISVPSNIAEGAARNSDAEFGNFLNIAKGSLSELETQLLISVRQGYAEKDDEAFDLISKASSQLSGLYTHVKNR